MPGRASPVELSEPDRAELSRRAADHRTPPRHALRARIVLLAADGLTGTRIAERVGCSEPTVVLWRRRFLAEGMGGLEDRERSGLRPEVLTEEVRELVLAATLVPPPSHPGGSPWSSRSLASRLADSGTQLSHHSVSRLWRRLGIRPCAGGEFLLGTRPEVRGRFTDVLGIFLSPLVNAVVISPATPGVDEPAVPGTDRGQGTPDRTARNLTALRATLQSGVERAEGDSVPDEQHRDFEAFLDRVAAARPASRLHVICDDETVQEYPNITAWSVQNRSITLHTTTTPQSWPELVELLLLATADPVVGPLPFAAAREIRERISDLIGSPGRGGRPRPLTWVADLPVESDPIPANPVDRDVARTAHSTSSPEPQTAVVPEAEPEPGTRRTTAEVRDALLRAAAQVFARRGYGAGTTKEIALRAGSTEKAIYRHFGSKTDLFTAAVVQPFVGMLQDYTAAFERDLAAGDADRSIKTWISELYNHLSENREAVLALLSSGGDPEARIAVATAVSRLDQMFTELRTLSLQVYASDPQLRPEPGRLWARIVTGLLISITALEPIVLSVEASQHSDEDLIEAVSDLVLYGVYDDGRANPGRPAGPAVIS